MLNKKFKITLAGLSVGATIAALCLPASSATTRATLQDSAGHSSSLTPTPQPWNVADAVETAKIYFQRAQTKARAKDYQGAIADYSEVIRLVPEYDKPYVLRGNLKDMTGDPAGALNDYQKAIAINPQNYLAYYNRAVTLEGMANYNEAIADYSKTIQLKPDFVSAHKNRGLNYLKVKNLPSAVQDIRTASALYQKAGNQQGYQQMQQILKALGQ